MYNNTARRYSSTTTRWQAPQSHYSKYRIAHVVWHTMVKTAAAVVTLAVTAVASTSVAAFLAPSAALLRATSSNNTPRGAKRATAAPCMKYVPDGLSADEWKKIQAKEKDSKKGVNLGHVGVKGFKSRSLQAWQEAGSSHLFPVNPKKVNTLIMERFCPRPFVLSGSRHALCRCFPAELARVHARVFDGFLGLFFFCRRAMILVRPCQGGFRR